MGEKTKIREFRGLKTYIDPADMENGYFNTFKNIRPYAGYAKAQSLKAEDNNFSVPAGQDLVLYKYVFLDEDKHKNKFNGKIIYDYIQNIKKSKLIITYGNNYSSTGYSIYIDNEFIGIHSIVDEGIQYPRIINENGIIKIFFTEKAYWVGKIHRWKWTETEAVLTEGTIMYPLVHTLGQNNNYYVTTLNDTAEKLYTIYRVEHSVVEHSIWGNQHRYALYDEFDNFIFLPTSDGYLWTLFLSIYENDPNIDPFGGFFKFDGMNPAPSVARHGVVNIPWIHVEPGDEHLVIKDALNGLDKGWAPEGIYYLYKRFDEGQHFTDSILQWLTNMIPDYNAYEEGHGYTKIINKSEVGIPSGKPYVEIITTAVINNNEFAIDYTSERFDVAQDYVVSLKVSLRANFPSTDVEVLVFYARYAEDKFQAQQIDFEQFATVPLMSEIEPDLKVFLTSLSTNGIFLAQTIGKAINPDTYEIIHNPSDYISINGVAFALRGGNVHYPAVGTGTVLNNVFYPENIIPQIYGKYLTNIDNKLAVFAENEELMTLIDFQVVSGQLLFFTRGRATYKIKNHWDLIETPEGTIISLKDGIYVSNGDKRTMISLPINDIIRENYDTSSIYYNSYEKEVIYFSGNKLFIYRFETASWSEMDIAGITLKRSDGSEPIIVNNGWEPTNEPVTIIDIIDDYAGNMYGVFSNNKIYKITYQNAIGTFKLDYVDAQELTYKKRLNWMAVDADGSVNGTTVDEGRTIYMFNRMLKDRKPNSWIEIGAQFTGTLYNIELDTEIFPTRKV